MLAGADRLPAKSKYRVLFNIIKDPAAPVRTIFSGQAKLSGVQAIGTHRLLRLDPQTQTCLASMTPALTNSEFQPVTLQLSALSTEALKTIVIWQQNSSLDVHVAGFVDAFRNRSMMLR